MSSRRQISIPLGGRYRQVSLYTQIIEYTMVQWSYSFIFIYTTSSLSLCRRIWRCWTYKMFVRYILSSVCLWLYQFSAISHAIYAWGCVYSAYPFLLQWLWEYVYLLSYHHHQIGSMTNLSLFWVKPWNNGMRCMSFYMLIKIRRPHGRLIFIMKITSGNTIFILKTGPRILYRVSLKYEILHTPYQHITGVLTPLVLTNVLSVEYCCQNM